MKNNPPSRDDFAYNAQANLQSWLYNLCSVILAL